MDGGKKTWYFPDGYLPEKSHSGKMEAHEALMLLNTNTAEAEVKIDIYFENRDPVRDITVRIAPERVRTLRMDHPEDLNGTMLPALTQYSLRVRASHNLVVQFGRLDTTQDNMAYYTGVGYCE